MGIFLIKIILLLIYNSIHSTQIENSMAKLNDHEEQGQKIYEKFSEEAQQVIENIMTKRWQMFINITETNKRKLNNATTLSSRFSLEKMNILKNVNWRTFKDKDLKRKFQKSIAILGDSGLTDVEKLNKWKHIKTEMNRKFSTAKIRINNVAVPLEPNITLLFQNSRDYNFLSSLWKMWRDSSGKTYANLYPDYVKLSNEATKDFGFKDFGEFSRSHFETPNLIEEFDQIFAKLQKLYRLIHSYVKKKLAEIYPDRIRLDQGALPAHVFGDNWAQQWHNIFEDIKPFKNKTFLDVTPNMRKKNLTVLDLFRISEEFFVSLGLDPMPQEFWEHSLFEKPNDGREINCHPSAWDFFNGKDFRIKMCTKVSMNDLFVIHHEMGHIHYYMNYKNQPFVYKDGANPGFHEALGDLMTLSVMTPAHLKKIHLLDDFVEDEEVDINFLLFSALQSIAFAPFAYTVEKWRWDVFAGNTTPANYNLEWWRLRCKYQGLVPPVERSHEDFDPGSKYHIAATVPYDRYFAALILKFQFHDTLCRVSNHTGPLYKCDIYQSKEAGDKLRKMMQKGSSVPWPEVLNEFTDGRTNRIDAQSLLDYFQPLVEWLEKQNLTDTDWHCENYIDEKRGIVRSYDAYQTSLLNESSQFQTKQAFFLLIIISILLRVTKSSFNLSL